MAGEIYQAFDNGETLYALVYRPSDGAIYDVGDTAFEAVGTWNDARADECDIQMTAYGDMHLADFPSVAAGTYLVEIRNQAGASPDAEDDYIISHGIIVWDGSAEILASDLSDDIAVIDANVDTLIIAQQTVNNAFPAEAPDDAKPRIINL
jgi:hypothetical protein